MLNKKQDGVTVYFRESLHLGLSIKTECEISAPLEVVIEAVWERRMEWDKYVKKYEVKKHMKQFKSDLILMNVEVPGRKKIDFSLLRSMRRTEDAFFLASHSVIHEAIPHNEGMYCFLLVLNANINFSQALFVGRPVLVVLYCKEERLKRKQK